MNYSHCSVTLLVNNLFWKSNLSLRNDGSATCVDDRLGNMLAVNLFLFSLNTINDLEWDTYDFLGKGPFHNLIFLFLY